jgi:hypothetical protein
VRHLRARNAANRRAAIPARAAFPGPSRAFRVRPKIAALLGFVNYAPSILAWIKQNFSNVNANTGLTDREIVQAIEAIREIYQRPGADRTRAGHQTTRAAAAAALGWNDDAKKRAILVLLMFLEDLTDQLHKDWLFGKVGIASYTTAARQTAANIATGAQSVVQETAREFVQTAARAARAGLDEAGAVLPWYLNPKLLLPLGLAGLAWFYIAPLMPRRPRYKKNPISKREAQKKLQKDAEEKYLEFHAKPPRRRKKIMLPDLGEMVELGSALEIGYRSKKWTGKAENYLHKFGKKVSLLASADGKALVITGGDLNVESRGITG